MNFLIGFLFVLSVYNTGNIDREQFYKVFESDSPENIKELLLHYQNIPVTESLNKVFKGALLIKKSAYLNTLSDRVEYFKLGRELIEEEIKKYPQEIEYRFIRLILQEQTPQVLRYKNEISEDKNIILESWNSIDNELKKRIIDYAAKSEVLDLNEFDREL